MKENIAGRLAGAFLQSKLTPLLMMAALAVGAWTVVTMPSEEEPQIIVPLADLYLPLPGATPQEVENRVLVPLENVLSGIEGVEYVYGHAEPGFGLVTVRYEVGLDMEESLVKLYSTLMKNMDRMPPGLMFPLVKTVTIDDVPFFTATLFGGDMDGGELRRVADEVRAELSSLPDVRDAQVTGGQPREIRVELNPEQLATYGIDPLRVAQRLAAENVEGEAGTFTADDRVVRVTAGSFLADAGDVENVVLDVRNGALVQVRDVARVIDGPAEVSSYTFHSEGGSDWVPMVTVGVSKRPGADATQVGRALEHKLDELKGRVVPENTTVKVTRNYGETARHKVLTLQEHLALAVVSVGLVILLTMGWRAAVVVMISVPLTFALTLFVYQVFGYTLNRVTLFALIFVTGIVVDDSIIVAENMERHFKMKDRPLRAAAVAAVDEVGNPTILATLTVIAAVLPMLFVSGLMGPYMSPMPVGATVAMLFSLAVALIVTPWLAFKLLGAGHGHEGGEEYALEKTWIYRNYEMVMRPLLARPRQMAMALGAVAVLLLGAAGMFLTRWVEVKMLPFDDKNEVQVILDMPEGTPLETTLALATDMGRAVGSVAEVADVQMYAGVAAPFNFNGMIRHYYLRQGAHVADLQVNLVDKGERKLESHDVALVLRPIVEEIATRSGTGARVKVVEVPPGPPVMSTLVAEIYGDDEAERVRVAREVMDRFEAAEGVVDVDWSLTDPMPELRMEVDAEKAALSGVAKEQVVGALRLALAGQVVTHLSVPESRSPVPVRVRVPEADRSGEDRLGRIHLGSMMGTMVPAGELVRTVEATRPQVVDRKNGKPVIYVMGEVAGSVESPVYAILDMEESLNEIEVAGGGGLGVLMSREPSSTERPVMKWDGEWQITYEVFRDLGIAFAGALVLIYILIVAWFGSFVTPLVMMAAIPLTLIGIAPGHLLVGAFFTATSMIGMIALAGIMVRNGILLIDYLEARLEAGVPLEKAIIEAGAVRTRPIVITAAAVVIGAFVILFDPIFQGLAVALIAGSVASTVLSLLVVPGIYFLMNRNAKEVTP
ncbi:MAG TPA: efflux RND transporter permease subunit [Longimicrobiales bacterium]|nr:efflux RND transporter permease subunit [Longimicrobiales bacterium]